MKLYFSNRNFSLCIFAIVLIGSCYAVQYNTNKGVQDAINNAGIGESIIISNGIYDDFILNIPSKKSGIKLTAETPGQVIFKGLFQIIISGYNNTLSGFQFINGSKTAPSNMIDIRGDFNTITQCNWKNYNAQHYISTKLETKYNTISYCNIENKPQTAPVGSMIQLMPAKGGSYHRVSYCTFQNMPGNGNIYYLVI